jgi:hypothetical protein
MGPTISQFPASAFAAGATGVEIAGTLPTPQPQSSNNPIPQAVKLNQAQIFIWLKI